jgi:hypothetical protein
MGLMDVILRDMGSAEIKIGKLKAELSQAQEKIRSLEGVIKSLTNAELQPASGTPDVFAVVRSDLHISKSQARRRATVKGEDMGDFELVVKKSDYDELHRRFMSLEEYLSRDF